MRLCYALAGDATRRSIESSWIWKALVTLRKLWSLTNGLLHMTALASRDRRVYNVLFSIVAGTCWLRMSGNPTGVLTACTQLAHLQNRTSIGSVAA